MIDVSYILNIISNFYYISYDEFIETNRDNIEKYAEEHRDEILLEMIHGDFSYLFDQYKNEFIETYRSEHFEDYRLQYYLSYYKDHYKTEYDGYFQQYKQDNPGATDEEAANHADEMALSTGYKENANIWAIDQADGRIASECANPAAEYAEEKAMADENVIQALPTYTQNMFYQANHPQYNDKYNGDLIWRYESILRSGRYDSDDGTYYAKESDYAEAIAFFRDFINDYSDYYDFSLPQVSLIDENTSIAYGTDFTVAGVYCGMEGRSSILFSQSDCDALHARYGQDQGSSYTASETKYERTADARYNLIAMRFPDRGTLSSIVYGSKAEDTDDDSFYTLYSGITMSLNQVNSMIGTFEQIFLWVGLVMALFSMLLLFNFISVSISYKKKEIGILRAVGARSADVFKIFYSESAIIAAICFVLAMVASFITCGILNNTLAGQLGVSIFVFGPLSWLVMLGIAVVTSIIATFLPVYGIAKRRPVESIRAL